MTEIEWFMGLSVEVQSFVAVGAALLLWALIWACIVIYNGIEPIRDTQKEELDRQCGRGGVVLKNEIQRKN